MGDLRPFKPKEETPEKALGNVLRLLRNVWLSFLHKDENGLNLFHIVDVIEDHVILAVPLKHIDKIKKED